MSRRLDVVEAGHGLEALDSAPAHARDVNRLTTPEGNGDDIQCKTVEGEFL